MHGIPPLTVAVPLAVAALIAAIGSFLPRPAVAATALAGGAATAVLQFLALFGSWPHGLDHWFGGWTPQHGFPVGIVFTVDPLDGSLACVAGVLMVAALTYSVAALREVSHLYYAMMLVFVGGMSGFAVSGDLFNLFVFYELMSVSGYALCGFRHTSSTVIQGALNFAIVNSVGAFFILMGIALVYARTGALNLAEIAVKLHGQRPDGLLVVSFVFVMVGFLTKAGAVPFHFWLSDAYAVAAAPVGCMYAGIMSDLGYHAVARIYSSAYAGSLGSAESSVRGMLVGVGVATVLVGGVMCFLQADIKRQMAFLVIGHGGIFLCGIGLLDPAGLAGSTMYVAADGMLKGAAFLVIGYLVVSLGASDELLLHGRGRSRRYMAAGVALAACGVGLAAVPGIGPWLSASLILKGASAQGYSWLPPVLAVGTVLTAGAVLRSTARVFLGWGPRHDALLTSNEPDEPEEGEPEEEEREPLSPLVLLPAAGLLVAGYGMAFAPHLAGYAEVAASRALDLHGYISQVIDGHHPPAPA
ncbi:MAG TPA: proton-conducting transporter membrane subunit, partial [Acidimicrobiales bacterium]|nr:proton-conducting transporter membrane subunit [Acidimicrobiales bacterium]